MQRSVLTARPAGRHHPTSPLVGVGAPARGLRAAGRPCCARPRALCEASGRRAVARAGQAEAAQRQLVQAATPAEAPPRASSSGVSISSSGSSSSRGGSSSSSGGGSSSARGSGGARQSSLPAPVALAAAGGGGGGGGTSRQWRLGAAAAAALVAAAAAGAAHAEPLAQLSQTMAAVKIPGLVGDSQFTEGFVSGLLLIFFSEIGDKTFFIALLLALREDRTAVFAGTFGALAVMTVISVALGQVFHQLDGLLPAGTNLPLDDLLAVALLLYFGVNTLKGAADASARAAEEKEEAGEAVTALAGGGGAAAAALVASTFSLVFAAEWGDKSFLATIALAAASDPAGVVVGAVAGHGLATGLAVAGGSLLSRYISEVTAQYIGGSLFLVFAGATVFDLVTGAHGG